MNFLLRASQLIQERDLTLGDIKRWLRGGKSIKLGDTWYTITNKSSSAEAFAVRTADWELERGKKLQQKFITFEDILDNVNNGTWMVKINDKAVGKNADDDGDKKQTDEKSQQSVDPIDKSLALTRALVHRRALGYDR